MFETTADGVQFEYSVFPAPDVVDNQWHHVAASWDGQTKRVYLDGIERASEVQTVLDSTEPVVIGADRDFNVRSRFHRGGMDDLRFYGRALSAAEIQLLATP